MTTIDIVCFICINSYWLYYQNNETDKKYVRPNLVVAARDVSTHIIIWLGIGNRRKENYRVPLELEDKTLILS
jgi:hypothetical protein